MRNISLYCLNEIAEGLVEYEDAEQASQGVLPNDSKEDIRAVLWENLEAVVEEADLDPGDLFGTQYSGEHIAHELEPDAEVFYFDYPGGRIEIGGPEVGSRLSVLKELSEGCDREEAVDLHYTQPSSWKDVEMCIDPALDDDHYLKPEYQEDLEQIMDIKRDKGQEPFGGSSGDR